MSPARRRYERALGAIFVLIGICFAIPLIVLWLSASHEYTIGLSVNLLPRILPISGFVGVIIILGGITLLRRP
jgi:hypothetical protein